MKSQRVHCAVYVTGACFSGHNKSDGSVDKTL
jgi:hypothetical protein